MAKNDLDKLRRSSILVETSPNHFEVKGGVPPWILTVLAVLGTVILIVILISGISQMRQNWRYNNQIEAAQTAAKTLQIEVIDGLIYFTNFSSAISNACGIPEEMMAGKYPEASKMNIPGYLYMPFDLDGHHYEAKYYIHKVEGQGMITEFEQCSVDYDKTILR